MNYSNTIIIFILIFSIHVYTINSFNCEYDIIETKQSNTSIININCKGDICNVDNQENKLSDKYFLKINSAGTYNIQGELNGQILVEASEEDFVHLIFEGIKIESKYGPAILIAGAEKVTLTLNGENTLSYSETNSNGATFYSISNLTINGKGKLNIKNKDKDAIFCAKELKLISGIISIEIVVPLKQKIHDNPTTIIAKDSIYIDDNLKFEYEIINDSKDTIPIPSISANPPKSLSTTTTSRILATTCSSAILSQGYPCCPSNCVVVYVDECGTWGVYSNRWCGCKGGGNNNYSCQPNILRQGYKCCSYHNCRLILKDESGKWGVENGQWCGLHFNCK